MYTNFTKELWNLSLWNQSHILSSSSSSSSSSSLVVTQVESTNYNVYVILKHYITIPILIISILCIIVTLVAVTRRGLWRTTVTYIVVLAIVDLFTLLSLCILSMDYFIIPALPEGICTRVYHLIETILDELVDTLLLISNWLTVLIATERYFAVCHPLKVRFIDRRYRRIFILFVILSSLLFRLPGFIILGYTTEINLPYNLILFRKLYIWIVQIILLLIIPFSILTFVNVRLIQTVRYSSHLIKRRRKISKKELITTFTSIKSERGLLNKLRLYCCSISKCKGFCCRLLNLKTERMNSCQLHSLDQQNGSNTMTMMIMMKKNKSDLLQVTDLSPLNSPASLTASEPTGAQLGRSHREEKKITITLVCLIITFFICQGPFVLTTVIMSYTSSGLYKTDTNKIASNTSLLLLDTYTTETTMHTLNEPFSAVNYINSISIIALALKSDLSFFFYCWFCDRFLFALRKMMQYKCLQRSSHQDNRHTYYHNHHHQHHHHCNHRNLHCHQNCRRKPITLCNSHPQIQKFTKPRHNQEIIELNMPSGADCLLPDYQLPHHHYNKYGREYYQYRLPSDMSSSNNNNSSNSNQQKILSYKKPAPLPFSLTKHHKRIPVINLPMNSKFSWSSPSCSDNSHKCSSPKKRSSSLGPSKGRVKSLNSLKMNI